MNKQLVDSFVYVMNRISAEHNKIYGKDGCKERIQPETLRDLVCIAFDDFYLSLKNSSNAIPWKSLTENDAMNLRLIPYLSKDSLDSSITKVRNNKYYNSTIREDIIQKMGHLENVWLIPSYLYPLIPEGLQLITVNGDIIKNDGKLPIESRCGYLGYGIQIPYQEAIDDIQ